MEYKYFKYYGLSIIPIGVSLGLVFDNILLGTIIGVIFGMFMFILLGKLLNKPK